MCAGEREVPRRSEGGVTLQRDVTFEFGCKRHNRGKRKVENAPQVQCSYSVPTKIVLENHVGAGDATATRCQQGGHFSAQREGGSLVSSCCEHAASPKVPNEPVLTRETN